MDRRTFLRNFLLATTTFAAPTVVSLAVSKDARRCVGETWEKLTTLFQESGAHDRAAPTEKETSDALHPRLAQDYLRTGILPPEDALRPILLADEFAQFQERTGHPGSASGFEDTYQRFINDILRRVGGEITMTDQETGMARDYGSTTPILLRRLKRAFHNRAGNTYNRDNNTVADAVLARRYQCKSGVRTFSAMVQQLLAQQRIPELQPGERLVEVHFEGHVRLGMLLPPNDRLITFEMTTTGDGITDFGPLKEIKEPPMQVALADHALCQAALGVRKPEGMVLLDTAPQELKARHLAAVARSSRRGDWLGFGEAKEQPGDRPMSKRDYIPRNEGRETTYGSENSGGVMSNDEGKEYSRDEFIDLLHRDPRTTADELEHMNAYLRLEDRLIELYNEAAPFQGDAVRYIQYRERGRASQQPPPRPPDASVRHAMTMIPRYVEQMRQAVREADGETHFAQAKPVFDRLGVDSGFSHLGPTRACNVLESWMEYVKENWPKYSSE